MDYVEMAKKKAEQKREEGRLAQERNEIERANRQKRKQEIYNELVEGMEQWDNVLDFRVVVVDIDRPYAQIYVNKSNRLYLTLAIKWDTWDVSYSDDCHSTCEGFIIEVRSTDWRDEVKQEFRGDNLVEDALNYIASHMSKYF